MKKILLRTLKLLIAAYLLLCIALCFFQERLIFFPEKLPKDFKFKFDHPFEELKIIADGNKFLSGLLFKSDSSKGLIFYLHGNGGSLKSWGEIAKTYTDLHYDLFLLDYRGFGRSEGSINYQDQVFRDIQLVYDELKKRYAEDKIVMLGYSIGTGPAANLAANNKPRLLVLQAPYFSLVDMMRHTYPIIPTFILKYKFRTNGYLQKCKMPVVIFHGDADEVVYYGSSIKLKEFCKNQDTLITLKGQRHNGITENGEYKVEIEKLLEK